MQPLNDDELRDLLRQWEAPAAPPHLESRIFAGPRRQPWYEWLLTGSIRVPVPALVALLAILSAVVAVLPRRSQPLPAPAREVRLSDFQPVSELKPRIIRRPMRTTSLLLLAACACPGAQVIMSGSGSKPGVSFRYETRIEPELPGQKIVGFGGGGIAVGAGAFHRYLTDSTARKYFGYDLSLEPQPGGLIRVTFHPLSLNPEKLQLEPPGGWTALPLPRLPPPQMVRSRDRIALDLFVHPVTGQKIVDYLVIGEDDRAVVRLPSGPPRDYTVEDVPLTLSKLRLAVNGKQLEEWGGGMSGTAVFFYLPGYGRFVVSLAPHTDLGFRKSGQVRGNTLAIHSGADTFLFECDGPIAPGGGAFNLYVYHDPTWRPRGGPDAFQLGASSARSLVRR